MPLEYSSWPLLKGIRQQTEEYKILFDGEPLLALLGRSRRRPFFVSCVAGCVGALLIISTTPPVDPPHALIVTPLVASLLLKAFFIPMLQQTLHNKYQREPLVLRGSRVDPMPWFSNQNGVWARGAGA